MAGMLPVRSTRSRGPSPKRPALSGSASFEPSGAVDPHDQHPVFQAGRVAVITGAASGIGAAAARAFARLGMKIALADLPSTLPALNALATELIALLGDHDDASNSVLVVPTDVSVLADVQTLSERVHDAWSEVGVLMNNAGIGGLDGARVRTSWDGIDAWHAVFNVNLFGVVNVQQVFVPVRLFFLLFFTLFLPYSNWGFLLVLLFFGRPGVSCGLTSRDALLLSGDTSHLAPFPAASIALSTRVMAISRRSAIDMYIALKR
ncbi:hypothetical protein MSAN_01338700 [Mycena sanguinolenta]|uniref:Uncharacterized protein n=1 Tax=Mycena sanguinolenta TaxID=230812 RepID=A0A8H6YF92_9AGAR|nr:hypothetical protein MSAN_01338700 [Mycena sanguinolenta]